MWFLLLGCATERGQREADEVVPYSGYVFRGPTSEDDDLLDEGAVVFTSSGAAVEAEQPYDGYPGYWRAELPAGAPFDLLVTAPEAWPVRWAGTVPANSGQWFSGALFGGDAVQVVDFATALQAPGYRDLDVADTGAVHVFGSAWDGEAWDCALLTVNDEPATCYLQDEETGEVAIVDEGPVTFFVRLGLPPGPVEVAHAEAVQTWPAEGGEVVYAFWFVGAP